MAAFLAGRIGFPGIAALVEATLARPAAAACWRELESIDDALAVDHNARFGRDLLPEIAAKAS